MQRGALPIRLALCGGLLGMILQLCLVRESLALNQSNELAASLVLGLWLTVTGLGAIFSRYIRATESMNLAALGILSLAGPAGIILFRLLPLWMGRHPGEATPPDILVGCAVVIICPLCLINGALFTLPVRQIMVQHTPHRGVRWIYASETAGGLLGAAVVTILLPLRFNPFSILGIGSLLIAAILMDRWRRGLPPMLLCLGLVLVFSGPLINKSVDRHLWPGYQLVQSFDSSFSRYHLVQYETILSLFENGTLRAESEPAADPETLACLALAVHGNPKRVLCIEGVLSDALTITSQLPDPDISVAYLDPDPLQAIPPGYLNRLQPEYHASAIRKLPGNPNHTIRTFPPQSLDVIIAMTGAPTSLSASRLFTAGFFHTIRTALSPDGVFAVSFPGSENIVNPAQTRMLRILLNTLATEFPDENILIVPGDTLFILAHARRPIRNLDVETVLESLNSLDIRTHYAVTGYLPFKFSPFNRRQLLETVLSDPSQAIHTEQHPLMFATWLDLWTTRWKRGAFRPFQTVQKHGSTMIISLVLLITAVSLVSKQRSWILSWSVAVSGGSVITAEIMLMFLIQIRTGALYRDAGILIGLCTAGLCAGSLAAGRLPGSRKGVAGVQCLIAILFCLGFIGRPHFHLPPWIQLYLPGFLFGFLGGGHFGLASRMSPRSTPVFYGADLAGAAVASFFVVLFVLPVMGSQTIAVTMMMINVIFALQLLFRVKPAE